MSFRPIANDAARLAALLSGTVDLIDKVPMTDVARLRGDAKVAPETVRLVKETAEKMGYKANPGVAMWMAHVRRGRGPRFRETIAYVHTVPPDHSLRSYVPFARYLDGAKSGQRSWGMSCGSSSGTRRA